MSGIIGVVVAILLAALFGWLASRAWRIRNLVGKLTAGIASSLVTLVVLAVAALGLAGLYRLDTPHGSAAPAVTIKATPEQLALGAERARYCAGCHSGTGDPPLSGGARNFIGGLGTLYAPNLTPGGDLAGWTDGQIMRAIREGVDAQGHPLMIMPSDAFHHLSDGDTEAIVAYLRSQPAVTHAVPARDVSLLGLVIVGTGLFPTSAQPAVAEPQMAPPSGVTAQYGQYLVETIGCAECHGAHLTGGTPGQGAPVGSNLTYIVPQWSQAQFVAIFHSGVDPTGHTVSPDMPWKQIGQAYSDDELRALYTYLHALPATKGSNG